MGAIGPRLMDAIKELGQRLEAAGPALFPDIPQLGQTREPHLEGFLTRIVKPGDVFWDIGANVGPNAAHFRSLLPEAPILCVEVNPILIAALVRNVSPPLTVVPAPVWEAANVPLNMGRFLGSGGTCVADKEYRPEDDPFSTRQNEFIRHATRFWFPSVTLDWLLTVAPQPSILKIDIEGAEVRVLRASIQVLANTKWIIAESTDATMAYYHTTGATLDACLEVKGFRKVEQSGLNSYYERA